MALSKKTRFAIFDRDKFTCRYCGRNSEDVTLEVDHINPVSKGGSDDPSNLVTACFDCNRGKSDTVINSCPPVDYLAMAQEMREQEALSSIMAEKARKDLEDRISFEANIRTVTHWPDDLEFDKGTVSVLYSFTKEFTAPVVLLWIEKAALAIGGCDDRAIGRYVSGIRRKVKEAA